MIKAPEDFIVEELPLYEPTRTGTHTFFAMRKRNLSTLEAIHRIARDLQVRTEQLGYAGLKDKNAVTTQVLSVEGVPPERVLKIVQPDIEVLWGGTASAQITGGTPAGQPISDSPPRYASRCAIACRIDDEAVGNGRGAESFWGTAVREQKRFTSDWQSVSKGGLGCCVALHAHGRYPTGGCCRTPDATRIGEEVPGKGCPMYSTSAAQVVFIGISGILV